MSNTITMSSINELLVKDTVTLDELIQVYHATQEQWRQDKISNNLTLNQVIIRRQAIEMMKDVNSPTDFDRNIIFNLCKIFWNI